MNKNLEMCFQMQKKKTYGGHERSFMKFPCVNCITRIMCKNDYRRNGKFSLERKCSILQEYLGSELKSPPKVYRKRSKVVHRFFEVRKKQFTTIIRIQGL